MKPFKLIAALSILFMVAGTFAHGLRSDHPNYNEIKFDVISIQQPKPTCDKKDCKKEMSCDQGDQCLHKSHLCKKQERKQRCSGNVPNKENKRAVPARAKPVKAMKVKINKRQITKEKRFKIK